MYQKGSFLALLAPVIHGCTLFIPVREGLLLYPRSLVSSFTVILFDFLPLVL